MAFRILASGRVIEADTPAEMASLFGALGIRLGGPRLLTAGGDGRAPASEIVVDAAARAIARPVRPRTSDPKSREALDEQQAAERAAARRPGVCRAGRAAANKKLGPALDGRVLDALRGRGWLAASALLARVGTVSRTTLMRTVGGLVASRRLSTSGRGPRTKYAIAGTPAPSEPEGP